MRIHASRRFASILVNAIAGDTKGTFHGLGSIDASLREAKPGLVSPDPLGSLRRA
jgi:hypothetical protein